MSEKRKDNKGRILRTGESQRKDLIYQYRYTDIRGKRQTVYSSDLKELREKKRKSRSSSTMALIMPRQNQRHSTAGTLYQHQTGRALQYQKSASYPRVDQPVAASHSGSQRN